MTFASDLSGFRERTVAKMESAVREAIIQSGERVIELSPLGDPALWKRKPPADYSPGQFRSNWNYGLDGVNITTRPETKSRELHGLDAMPEHLVGRVHYVSNSLPYAMALEWGHSSQAPAPAGVVGRLVIELPQIADATARKFVT
jgi:hypothetical protein